MDRYMRFHPTGTAPEQQVWSAVHMLLALLFACVGAYTALLFVERAISRRISQIWEDKADGIVEADDVDDEQSGSDVRGVRMGLIAGGTCISINSGTLRRTGRGCARRTLCRARCV